MTTQVAFGNVWSKNGATLFKARISEAVSESGTSAASSGSARRGEVAEVISSAAVWITVSGTAAAGTTQYLAAGERIWVPVSAGDTISVITA